jgi:hypothetical protein
MIPNIPVNYPTGALGSASINQTNIHPSSTEISIYFNNVQGFVGKRSMFVNSNLARDHDVFILQESKLTSEHPLQYADWSLAGLNTLNLSYRDVTNFKSGMIVGYNPSILQCEQLNIDFGRWEIAAFRLYSLFDSCTVIAAYRSPSIPKNLIPDYFDSLADGVSQLTGKVIVVGDLNLSVDRPWMRGLSENIFLDQVANLGLTSIVEGYTRNNKQLDYTFTNFNSVAKISEGLGDHKAFIIDIDFKPDTFIVPKTYVVKSRQFSSDSIALMMEQNSHTLLNHHDMSSGELMLEYEIACWEIREMLFNGRIIKEHTRVRHQSRQLSETILDETLNPKEKHDKIVELRKTDAMRRFIKYSESPNLGPALSSLYGLTTKKDAFNNCKVDPEVFRDIILDDEASCNHNDHVVSKPLTSFIRERKSLNDEMVLGRLRNKWFCRPFFNNKFWTHILDIMFSDIDRGVTASALVEPVIKSKTNLSDPASWRLVWKTQSAVQKSYDLARSFFLDTDKIDNDAYTQCRSTSKTITKLMCWHMADLECLVGIDFKNAFGLCCRPCTNEMLGVEYIPEEISFNVSSNNKMSVPAVSLTGTGAGRASAGPAFNFTFHSHISRTEWYALFAKFLAAFADDSQFKQKIILWKSLKELWKFSVLQKMLVFKCMKLVRKPQPYLSVSLTLSTLKTFYLILILLLCRFLMLSNLLAWIFVLLETELSHTSTPMSLNLFHSTALNFLNFVVH